MRTRPMRLYEMRSRPKVRQHETREVEVDLEVRDGDEKPPRIVGHPIRYDVWSVDLGGFKERIVRGAARKTIGEADIRVLFNHDPNIILGRNRSGTASFTEDSVGVLMDTTPPETQLVRDMVLEPLRRKDINQMSFGFRSIQDEWREPKKVGGLWERDIHELQMFDGSVVTFPAYTQTDAAVRALVGELDGIGIDWSALNACLTRASRGLTLTDSDVDLLNGSIGVLRSFIPSEPDAIGAPLDEPQAGRDIAHLTRLLDVRERELTLV